MSDSHVLAHPTDEPETLGSVEAKAKAKPEPDEQEPDLDFNSISPKFRVVPIDGILYVVSEASARAVVEYKDACVRGAKMSDGKVIGVDKIAAAEPQLVAACLYQTVKKPGGNFFHHQFGGGKDEYAIKLDSQGDPVTVPFTTIMKWPDRIRKNLFKWIKMNSDDLVENETVAGIDKEIARLQKRRAKLLKEDEPPKDEPEPTTGDSD